MSTNLYTPEQNVASALNQVLLVFVNESGRSEITDFDEVVKLDVAYGRMDNLARYQILLKTIKVVVMKDGAK